MLSRPTRAACNRDKEKDRMLQHAWSPDRRAPWQHAGICYSSICSHVQLLALMWSLYHEVGRILAPSFPPSCQAAALPSALSILMSSEGNTALQNCSGMPYEMEGTPEDGFCRTLKDLFSVASDQACNVWTLADGFNFMHVMISRNQMSQSHVHTQTHKRKSPAPIPHIFSCTSWKTVCNDWKKDHTILPLDNGREEQKSGLWQGQYFILSLAYSADFVIKLPHLKPPFLQVWKWAVPVSQICEMSSYQNCFKRDRTDCHLPTGWEMRAAAFLQRWPWTSLSLPKLYLSWSLRC